MWDAKYNMLPQYCWSRDMECVVEVKSIGHFPNTVMVILPNDKVVEVERSDLEPNPA
jgi:hypothetical protein